MRHWLLSCSIPSMVKVLCICLFVLFSDLCSELRTGDHTQQHGRFVYTRNELLRQRPLLSPPSSWPLMPTVNTTQDASKKRKRGRRGGVKNRLRTRPAKSPHHLLYLQTSSRCTTKLKSFTQSADTTTSIEKPAWWPFARHGWTLPVQTMTSFWTGLLCTIQTEPKNRVKPEEAVCAFT